MSEDINQNNSQPNPDVDKWVDDQPNPDENHTEKEQEYYAEFYAVLEAQGVRQIAWYIFNHGEYIDFDPKRQAAYNKFRTKNRSAINTEVSRFKQQAAETERKRQEAKAAAERRRQRGVVTFCPSSTKQI